MRLYVGIFLVALLSGCNKASHDAIRLDDSPLQDLDVSTQIIMQLVEQHELSKVLEESDPAALKRLIKNFSPAEMAFEAEVLNWQQPVIMFFVQKQAADYKELHLILENFAHEHEKTIKFVEVDADELFKITEKFEISHLPALVLMDQRQELARVEGLDPQSIKDALKELFDGLIVK